MRPSPEDLTSRLEALTAEFEEPMTLDGLTADFKIFQRRRGHRHSTDDLLTAWYATVHAPPGGVASMLDLGAGIGSVGLSLAFHFPDVPLTAIEVQPMSFRLLRENVWANGVSGRVTMIHGDLRDSLPPGVFDLVTGSPPYFDVKAGIVSADPQRAGARFELNGTVDDYCLVAQRALAPGGRFVFCFPTAARARAERACAKASLPIVASRDVIPKEGLAPLFSLFACCRADEARAPSVVESALMVRRADGVHTPEMTAARAVFGLASQAP